MKRITMLLSMLLLVGLGFAENMEAEWEEVISIHYIAHFKLYAEANGEITEEKVLDVGENGSCFYGRFQRRREEIVDSITAAGGSQEELFGKINEYPSPRQFYAIYNNCPSAGKRTVTDRVIQRFHYVEDIDQIEWTLLDLDTTILGYQCQMASCQYRNHRWNVCYTPEIPVALGPWKLQGLPGLILYAADSTGIFSFECIEIRNNSRKIAQPNLTRSIQCSREEIKSLQRESLSNPEEFVKRFGATGKGTDANGRPIVYKKKTALFMD